MADKTRKIWLHHRPTAKEILIAEFDKEAKAWVASENVAAQINDFFTEASSDPDQYTLEAPYILRYLGVHPTKLEAFIPDAPRRWWNKVFG